MMNQISKALVTISLISAAFAAVAGTEQESAMRHDHTVGDGHQVMLDLLKRGEVVSVAPMNKERSDNKAINNTLKGNVRPYEIKIRTPDGRLHAVEFRGMPAKINNRSQGEAIKNNGQHKERRATKRKAEKEERENDDSGKRTIRGRGTQELNGKKDTWEM